MNTKYMEIAIKIANSIKNDVPVAALIVKDGKIISSGINQREKEQNALRHAEIIAIERANKKLNNWRLNDCEMYVTLEPCPMCAGAIIQSRIKSVYFGAYDFINGALGSKIDISMLLGVSMDIKGGILEEECKNILKSYFEKMRL